MPIHHSLASLVPLEKIRVIYAHPQTHEQCSGWIEQWREVPVIHTSSNASSAIEAKKTPNAGAILSVSAAAIYHIPVIVEHVENNPENTTRFVRISQNTRPGLPGGKVQHPDRPRHRPGRAALRPSWRLCTKKINLTRIESRPSKRGMGKYVFFLDYAVSGCTDEALRELEEITTIRNLGCYPDIRVPP